MTERCTRCEVVPDGPPENGVLYLAPPMGPTADSLQSYFSKGGYPHEQPFPGIIRVPYQAGDLDRICSEYLCNLSQMEMQDTRALAVEQGVEPGFGELVRMTPLSALAARVQGRWVAELLREERLTVHFQPIVECAEPTTVHAVECLMRGVAEDGSLVSPGAIIDMARSTDLLFLLDRAARINAIDAVAATGSGVRAFINFNPTSIYNPEYCLRTTMAAIERAGLDTDRIIFEVVESEEIADHEHLTNVLSFYRERGFAIALDDMGAGYSSLNLLSRLRPDYMKLDMELIRDVDQDPYKATITANLLDLGAKLGVRSIAEGVETEGEWRWLKDNGADLVQGFYFARPAADLPPPQSPSA